MSKQIKNYYHVVVEFKNHEMIDERLLENEARSRFSYFVNLAAELGFNRVRSIRLVRAGHVLYEFRDLRSIVKQQNMFDYE